MSIDEVMRIAVADRKAWIVTDEGMTARLRAAIAQHVAEAVAAETERCAKVCEAESARILSKQSNRDDDPVNVNLRMIACVLPDVAAAIRARADHDEATR